MKNSILIILLLSLSACATSTRVRLNTSPEGVSVYYQGSKLGKSPVRFRADNSIFERDDQIVVFKKNGKTIARRELRDEIKISNLIGAFFCVFPVLWVIGPKTIQNFDLEEEFNKDSAK